MGKPRCYQCDKSPPKRLPFQAESEPRLFCSMRCAAKNAIQAAGMIYRWCEACNNWQHEDDWGESKTWCKDCSEQQSP